MSAPLTDERLRTLRRLCHGMNDGYKATASPTAADVLALLDEVEAGRRERYTLRDLLDEFGGEPVCPLCNDEGRVHTWDGEDAGPCPCALEPVCDGSGRIDMPLSVRFTPCPGCSACHKNGGGGEAAAAPEAAPSTRAEPVPASPAAVREAAAEVLNEAKIAGRKTTDGYEFNSNETAAAMAVDALAAAGLLRPEPWTTHDGEGRWWQVEWVRMPSSDPDWEWDARLRPLPTEEASDGR